MQWSERILSCDSLGSVAAIFNVGITMSHDPESFLTTFVQSAVPAVQFCQSLASTDASTSRRGHTIAKCVGDRRPDCREPVVRDGAARHPCGRAAFHAP